MSIKKIITVAALVSAFISTGHQAQANTWLKVESPNYIIYSEETPKISEEYAKKLERFYYITSHLYIEMGDSHLKPAQKHSFYFFKNLSDYSIVRPGIKRNAFNPLYVCEEGFQYFTTSEAQYVNTDRTGADLVKGLDYDLAVMFMSLNQTLLIEYFSYPIPSWLWQGLGKYMMTAEIADDHIILGKPIPDTNWLHNNVGMAVSAKDKRYRADFGDIISGKRASENEVARGIQTWVIAHYMMSTTERRKQLKQFLILQSQGTPALEAFETSTGLTPAALDAIYDQYLSKGVPVSTYTLPPFPTSDISIEALPNYNEKLPLLNAATLACPSDDYGKKLLERIRKQANRTPDDPLTQETLMRAQILFGAPLDAKPYLDTRLTSNPEDFVAQYWSGRLYLQLAQDAPESLPAETRAEYYATARKELSKAYKINSGYAPLLYYFAVAHEDRADFPNQNVLNAIELAQNYSQNMYTMYEIELLVRANKKEAALAKLTLIRDKCDDSEWCGKVKDLFDAISSDAPKEVTLTKLDDLKK